jgi:hypothetical protein
MVVLLTACFKTKNLILFSLQFCAAKVQQRFGLCKFILHFYRKGTKKEHMRALIINNFALLRYKKMALHKSAIFIEFFQKITARSSKVA